MSTGLGTESTFTLLPGVPSSIQASFIIGWNRETYEVGPELKGGRTITTTDEYVKQGLRDLGLFTEA